MKKYHRQVRSLIKVEIFWIGLFIVACLACEPASAEYIEAWGRNNYRQCEVPDGNDFVAITSGHYQSLALKSDGSLVAWHYNDYKQCNVPAGSDFIKIASGCMFSFALKSDGSLVSWGRGNYGELDVSVGNDFVDIAAGSYHGLALKSDGSLSAWGRNNYGQCDVPAGDGYVAIAAGEWHNVALRIKTCTATIMGDVNGDCKVDFVDIALMAQNWLKCNIVPQELCWK